MKITTNKSGCFWTHFSSVRKTIALLLTVVFCYLSILGKITQDQFIPIFSMVLGYYFGKSTALDIPTNSNNETKNNNETI
ncbi:MAG: hypothetical protein RSE41_09900 [Clostridia bacterium]